MDWSGCPYVEVIPGNVSGVPLVRHSRVQADTVLESFELGEPVEDIAYSFSLDPDDIIAVLSYAGQRIPVTTTK
jgi:uncharacterized protein (DUF433 family)